MRGFIQYGSGPARGRQIEVFDGDIIGSHAASRVPLPPDAPLKAARVRCDDEGFWLEIIADGVCLVPPRDAGESWLEHGDRIRIQALGQELVFLSAPVEPARLELRREPPTTAAASSLLRRGGAPSRFEEGGLAHPCTRTVALGASADGSSLDPGRTFPAAMTGPSGTVALPGGDGQTLEVELDAPISGVDPLRTGRGPADPPAGAANARAREMGAPNVRETGEDARETAPGAAKALRPPGSMWLWTTLLSALTASLVTFALTLALGGPLLVGASAHRRLESPEAAASGGRESAGGAERGGGAGSGEPSGRGTEGEAPVLPAVPPEKTSADQPAQGAHEPRDHDVRKPAGTGTKVKQAGQQAKEPVSAPREQAKAPATPEEEPRRETPKIASSLGAPMVKVEITGTSSGNELRIDGARAGTLPFRRSLPAGTHRFAVYDLDQEAWLTFEAEVPSDGMRMRIDLRRRMVAINGKQHPLAGS